MTTLPAALNRPQYFHLLWDEEIERLRDVLQTLRQRETEVLTRWYQLYTVHFGEAVTLSEHEFIALYGYDLRQTVHFCSFATNLPCHKTIVVRNRVRAATNGRPAVFRYSIAPQAAVPYVQVLRCAGSQCIRSMPAERIDVGFQG